MTRFAIAATLCGVLACAFLPPAPAAAAGAQAARSGDKNVWAKNTKVLEGPEADPTCSGLTKAVLARIASIQALAAALEKDREKPARNLSGWVHTMMGGHYTSETTKRKLEALEKERQTADDLNRLLSTVGCPVLDIGAELSKSPAR